MDWAYMASHTAADVKLGCSAANAAAHVVPEFGSTRTVGVNASGFAQKFVSCPEPEPEPEPELDAVTCAEALEAHPTTTAVIHSRRFIASGERL